MKKIFVILTFLASTLYAFADKLSVNDVTLKNEDPASLDISLENISADIVGLQFNLVLPDGVVPKMEGNKVVITPSARIKSSYSIRGSVVADGSYLFTFLSNDRTPIDGHSGILISITLENSSVADGCYTANISNASTTDVRGNEQSLTDVSFPIMVIRSYRLTYMVDGVVYKEYTLDTGAPVVPETEPTKKGYVFSGWTEIPATMPAHDVVVNGWFILNMYKLTYKVDGVVYKEYTLDVGAPVVPEAEPIKEGHVFSGWIEIPTTMPAHDVVVNGWFVVNTYWVSVIESREPGSDGNIDLSEDQVPWGGSTILTVIPAEGSEIKSVMVGNDDVTSQLIDGKYTISNIKSDITVIVSFSRCTGLDPVKIGVSGNNVITDLFGRKVTKPIKGNIYIRNGKKVIEK